MPWAIGIAAVAFITSGSLLVADDQPTSSPDGYKTVNADAGGGKALPIRVKEQPDALAHANLTDELDHQRSFSATNPMSNKSYAFTADSVQSGSNFNKKSDQNTFITKPYSFDSNASTVPGLNTKASFPTNPISNSNNSDFNKSFTTASADLGPNQSSAFGSKKASEQDRTAVLGGPGTDTFASPLGEKRFIGDEAQSAKRSLTRLKSGQMYVQDLPNRPLTIDEVRNLIDHGFKPDTDKPPENEESKPLNDPGYVPKPIREAPEETAPATPAARPAADEDKEDAIPSPGMMSANPPPENSQPLPQR